MQVPAEIRWFWCSTPPPGLEEWFCKADAHGCHVGGGKLRRDEYLRNVHQVELGLKRRDGHKPAVGTHLVPNTSPEPGSQ